MREREKETERRKNEKAREQSEKKEEGNEENDGEAENEINGVCPVEWVYCVFRQVQKSTTRKSYK